MKRDHYIIPICSPSTPILDAICYLTQLTKFALQFVCFILRQCGGRGNKLSLSVAPIALRGIKKYYRVSVTLTLQLRLV